MFLHCDTEQITFYSSKAKEMWQEQGRFTPRGCRNCRSSKAVSSTAGRGQALWLIAAETLHGSREPFCLSRDVSALHSSVSYYKACLTDKNRQNILKLTHFLLCCLRVKILCVSSCVLHPFRGHCTKENEQVVSAVGSTGVLVAGTGMWWVPWPTMPYPLCPGCSRSKSVFS